MNIHEYQGKAVLKSIGAPVSEGVAIFDASEAKVAAEKLGGPLWVVKSQILSLIHISEPTRPY